MTNEVILRPSYLPQEVEFQTLQIMAKNAASSSLYKGVGNEQAIFLVLLAARELGIPPMQALNGGIYNIQGKIELSSRLMSAMIRRAGHSIRIVQSDEKKCIIEGTRADSGDSFSAQFTIEDAEKAGLANRQNWKTYTEDMLYSRAMSRLGRRLFADVIGTAYVEGEISDTVEVKKSSKQENISEIVEIEDPEEVEKTLIPFVNDFPEEEHEWVRKYIQRYAMHWKKKIVDAIDDYSDKDKFMKDLSRWKKQEVGKVAVA